MLAVLRASPGVLAIVGAASKVASIAQAPPSVRLVDSATTRYPFGAGSGRLGLQRWGGFAICYGTDDPAGEILARQLAGAVSDALHGVGPVPGATWIARAYAPDIAGALRDPPPPAGTGWPFYSVRIDATAAAQAVP